MKGKDGSSACMKQILHFWPLGGAILVVKYYLVLSKSKKVKFLNRCLFRANLKNYYGRFFSVSTNYFKFQKIIS